MAPNEGINFIICEKTEFAIKLTMISFNFDKWWQSINECLIFSIFGVIYFNKLSLSSKTVLNFLLIYCSGLTS